MSEVLEDSYSHDSNADSVCWDGDWWDAYAIEDEMAEFDADFYADDPALD